jgi:hypothetical protein
MRLNLPQNHIVLMFQKRCYNNPSQLSFLKSQLFTVAVGRNTQVYQAQDLRCLKTNALMQRHRSVTLPEEGAPSVGRRYYLVVLRLLRARYAVQPADFKQKSIRSNEMALRATPTRCRVMACCACNASPGRLTFSVVGPRRSHRHGHGK